MLSPDVVASWDDVKVLEGFLAPLMKIRAETHAPDASYAQLKLYDQVLLAVVEMPAFFAEPPASPVARLEAVAPFQYRVYDADGEVIFSGGDLVEAYDFADEAHDVLFSGDFSHVSKDWERGETMLFVPSDMYEEGSSKNSRLLLSYTSEDTFANSRDEFVFFLEGAVAYLKERSSFKNAWVFLNSHPFMWRRVKPDGALWVMDDNVARMSFDPYFSADGSVDYHFEAGSSTEGSGYTERYLDLRLTVCAASYEAGIIQLAANVHKFYFLDGSDREGVEYEKSEFEERLKEFGDDQEDD